MEIITPAQCRAARALLNWDQSDLAKRCGIHIQTISNFELERGSPTKRTLEKIVSTLETAGVEFTEKEGIRKNIKEIVTYKGQAEFVQFMWDVYRTVKEHGGEICVSNVDETLWTERLGEEDDRFYMKKMKELFKIKKFDFKVLIKEGDTNFIASSYAKYKWVPKEQFYSVPFYVYGDKLAFMLFDESVTIHVIQNLSIAKAQRFQFNLAWEKASIPTNPP